MRSGEAFDDYGDCREDELHGFAKLKMWIALLPTWNDLVTVVPIWPVFRPAMQESLSLKKKTNIDQ